MPDAHGASDGSSGANVVGKAAMVENKIAVDRNHAALKHILAGLVAMAGWTTTGGTFLRACGDPGSASGRPNTLPRHLYVAILRLLRPAEAATRRLVIVLSRGIVGKRREGVAAALGQVNCTSLKEDYRGFHCLP